MLGNTGLSIFGETISKDALLAMAGIGQGRSYYVNNITGDSGNGGLSWDSAMDEVSTAITASETYRALPAATNEYIRNTIFVQGTGTAYAECTAFPNYTNVIGLGANPFGYGAGIVRIGADLHTAETLGGGIYKVDGDCRGSYFYNIQFQSSNNRSSICVRHIFRTTFENCAFFASGDPISPPDCGFEIRGSAGGLHLINCHTGTNSGVNSEPWIGLKINGTVFMNCLVQGGSYSGMTAGIYVVAGCVTGWHSVVRDCFCGEGSQECAIGIDDNSTTGTIRFLNIMINAADPIEPADDATRFVGCVAGTAFVAT
jgi:hypothetical protein